MTGLQEVWERLTVGRAGRESAVQSQLAAGDRVGAELYLQFNDCLEAHKHHVFYGKSSGSCMGPDTTGGRRAYEGPSCT